MTAAVVWQQGDDSGSSATLRAPIDITPQPADVIYAVLMSYRSAGARPIVSVAGCGATWSLSPVATAHPAGDLTTTPRLQVFRGTGATFAGDVTTTVTNIQGASLAVFLVRGVPIDAPVAAGVTRNGTVGPVMPAGHGQAVLALTGGGGFSTRLGEALPPDGWRRGVDGAFVRLSVASRQPPELVATDHRIDTTADAGYSAIAYIGQVVVGELAPEPPPDPVDADRRWWTHRLAGALGLDPVAAQPVVEVRTPDPAGGGWLVDPDLSRALAGYTITGGRRETTAQTETMTATLRFASAHLPGPPSIATRVQVRFSDQVAAALGLVDPVRFTGEVTDPTVDHRAGYTTAVCAGRLGRAYRMPLDGTGWPAHDDGDRVAAILAALAGVGVPLESGTIDAGTVTLSPPTRLETAATLVDQVAKSSLGNLVEQPDGSVDWHDAEHRRGAVPAVVLPAAAVFRSVSWSQRLAGLVNDLDVKTAAGAVVTVRDPESADPGRYGPFPGAVDTLLTTPTDARNLGVDIVARRADPSWQLPDLTVDLLRTVTLDQLPAVLALRHGSLLELVDLPADFPLPRGRVFLEGWTETATPRTWSLSAVVSDPLQSGVGLRWIDFPDSDDYQWSDLDPEMSWFDAARIFDPADTLP